MDFPKNLKYTKTHEWILIEGNSGVVGITSYAAEQIGEVVSVDLPQIGKVVKMGEAVGAVESSKASSEIYTPVSGKIVEINNVLDDAPEKINESPYDEGWIFKLNIEKPQELNQLLDSAGYSKLIEQQEEKEK